MKILQHTTILFAILFSLCFSSCSTNIRNDLKKAQLKGEVLSVTEYTYAPAANTTNAEQKGRLLSKTIRHYNHQRFLMDNTSYNEFDSILHKEVSTHDETGRPIKIIYYDHTGSVLSETLLKYNQNGNCMESTSYKPSGIPSLRSKRIYDNDNNLIVNSDYSIAETLYSRQIYSNYTQDHNASQVIIQNFYNCDDIYCRLEYTNKFNEQGYTKEVRTIADGLFLETNTYEYKLDKANNWIYCLKRTTNIPSEIKERTLDYYK